MDDLKTGRNSVQFRAATSRDVYTLVALVQSAYRGQESRRGWTTEADLLEGQRVDAEMVRQILDKNNAMVLAGDLDGTTVACCELEHHRERNEVYLGMFAVDPSLQAAGIGRMVLEEAERVAASRWSAKQMAITVIELRSELIGWYERRGYVRTGRTSAFPYGDERFGVPLRDDLRFVELVKPIELN